MSAIFTRRNILIFDLVVLLCDSIIILVDSLIGHSVAWYLPALMIILIALLIATVAQEAW